MFGRRPQGTIWPFKKYSPQFTEGGIVPVPPRMLIVIKEELTHGTCSWWPHAIRTSQAGHYVRLTAGNYRAEVVELEDGWALCSDLLGDDTGRVFPSLSKAIAEWRQLVIGHLTGFVSIVKLEDGYHLRVWPVHES